MSIKKIKGAAHKNGDVDGMYRRSLRLGHHFEILSHILSVNCNFEFQRTLTASVVQRFVTVVAAIIVVVASPHVGYALLVVTLELVVCTARYG